MDLENKMRKIKIQGLMVGGPGRTASSSRSVTEDMLNSKNQRSYVISH